MPAAEYMRKHDLRVETTEQVCEPFQTFEAAGFPHDIMDEVRCSVCCASLASRNTWVPPPTLCCAVPTLANTCVPVLSRPHPHIVCVLCSLPPCKRHPPPTPQIRRAGFAAPTPIQAQAWPIALSGRDLVAIAKTGSGKTCGFLLPGMLHIQETRKDPRMGPTLLVLAPTRELAVQIKAEADKFGRSSGIRNT